MGAKVLKIILRQGFLKIVSTASPDFPQNFRGPDAFFLKHQPATKGIQAKKLLGTIY